MFDHYSQMSAHARKVAFLHPQAQDAWQDAVRENPDTDLNPPSDGLSSGNPLRSLAGGLKARFQQWQLSLSDQPAKQTGSQQPGLALGRHS